MGLLPPRHLSTGLGKWIVCPNVMFGPTKNGAKLGTHEIFPHATFANVCTCTGLRVFAIGRRDEGLGKEYL